MNLAVIEVTGKQYLVREGDIIETDRLPVSTGEAVSLDKVLLFWNGTELALGRPYLEGYAVNGELIAAGRGPKVIAFKYKRRKDYHRKVGHRQSVFTVKVKEIVFPGKPAAGTAPSEEKPAAKKPADGKKAAPKKGAKAGKKAAAPAD